MATTVLLNADIDTMVRGAPRAEALAFSGGRLLSVGSRAEVLAAAGPSPTVLDAGQATVLPGFIDAHQHPSIVALYGGAVRLVRPQVTDIASLQQALSRASAELPEGAWLVATEWDELVLDERRPPTLRELDDAVPNRPLMALHYSCHRAVANSRALELSGISRHTPEPSGGVIERGRGGLPTGLLIERGMSRVERLARRSLVAADAEGFLRRLEAHQRRVVEAGVTCVVDAAVPQDLGDLYREAARRGSLRVPTIMMPVSATGYLEAPRDVLDGPVTGEGDELLSVGPVKMVLDGAPGCAMCLGWLQTGGATLAAFALSIRLGSADPLRAMMSLAPRLGRSLRTGIHIYQPGEVGEIARSAAERGFSVACHAVGNEAIDRVLSAYESAAGPLARKAPPRIEHATLISHEQVARIARVGASVVAQPGFLTLPAFGSAPSIPGLRVTPLRWMLDAGVRVAGSSDNPVAGFDPLEGIRAALTRRTGRGHELEAEQRIGLGEALAIYTREAAAVSGCLASRGTLEVGKRADLVVLDRRLDERSVAEARVRAVVLGGDLVSGSPGTAEIASPTS